MKCETCHEPQPGMEHLFAGYGFCIQFCAEHCPSEVDGTECDSTIHQATQPAAHHVAHDPVQG